MVNERRYAVVSVTITAILVVSFWSLATVGVFLAVTGELSWLSLWLGTITLHSVSWASLWLSERALDRLTSYDDTPRT